jgi:hypothetical protein
MGFLLYSYTVEVHILKFNTSETIPSVEGQQTFHVQNTVQYNKSVEIVRHIFGRFLIDFYFSRPRNDNEQLYYNMS